MKIFICGFTGAGKSTLGLKLKNLLGNYKLFDLDREISNSLNISPGTLGKYLLSIGWNKFRELEKAELGKLLNKNEDALVSLGGGALSQENFDLIKSFPATKILFIDTPFDICFERIKNDKNRPISELNREDLQNVYLERLKMYRKADFVVLPEEVNSIDALERIVHNLSN